MSSRISWRCLLVRYFVFPLNFGLLMILWQKIFFTFNDFSLHIFLLLLRL